MAESFTPWALACSLITGCAFVVFEPAPYSPRQLSVVYSAQEDMTFITWQLPEHADADSVTFELASEDGTLRPIDLADAPFPAAPRRCGRATCFQYQIVGRFVPPAETPLLRVTHPRFGEFASAPGTLVEVEETFAIDPIALDRNGRADPRRFDYFAEQGIPFERSYRWRLTAAECGDDAAQPDFAPMDDIVELPEGWTTPACFESTPVRADAPGVVVRAPLVPSAETWLLPRQRYDAPALTHTTLYGVLFDLAIADAERCRQTREIVAARIDSAIRAGDPSAVSLGAFEPIDGAGCAAQPPSLFPVARMLSAAQDAALATDGEKTILWVLVSNRSEPSAAFEAAWSELLDGSAAIEPNPVFGWWIVPAERGGRETGPQWTIPYRPVEDETLFEDIDTIGRRATPFRTLDHDLETRIALELGGHARPEHARICQAVPRLASLEVAGVPVGDTFAWPERGAPLYTVDLGVQIGVPNELFVARSSEVQIEICARHCDGPFRAANGEDHASWLAASECAGHP